MANPKCLFQIVMFNASFVEKLSSKENVDSSTLSQLMKLQSQASAVSAINMKYPNLAFGVAGTIGSLLNLLVLKRLMMEDRSYIQTHMAVSVCELILSLILTELLGELDSGDSGHTLREFRIFLECMCWSAENILVVFSAFVRMQAVTKIVVKPDKILKIGVTFSFLFGVVAACIRHMAGTSISTDKFGNRFICRGYGHLFDDFFDNLFAALLISMTAVVVFKACQKQENPSVGQVALQENKQLLILYLCLAIPSILAGIANASRLAVSPFGQQMTVASENILDVSSILTGITNATRSVIRPFEKRITSHLPLSPLGKQTTMTSENIFSVSSILTGITNDTTSGIKPFGKRVTDGNYHVTGAYLRLMESYINFRLADRFVDATLYMAHTMNFYYYITFSPAFRKEGKNLLNLFIGGAKNIARKLFCLSNKVGPQPGIPQDGQPELELQEL